MCVCSVCVCVCVQRVCVCVQRVCVCAACVCVCSVCVCVQRVCVCSVCVCVQRVCVCGACVCVCSVCVCVQRVCVCAAMSHPAGDVFMFGQGSNGVHSTKSLFLPTDINLGDPPQTQMTDKVKIVYNIIPNVRSISFLLLTFIAIDMPTSKQCVVMCIWLHVYADCVVFVDFVLCVVLF